MTSAPHITIATSGHIDHGKSTLVQALTGVHPDRLLEEQRRGISIELGFAHTHIGDLAVSFVDVPGHERFVRHMLAGIGGIDAVLLVVAANESVMPQTREHLAIASQLGVARGIIVLTKADLVDAEMLDLVRLEVGDEVAGTFLESAPVLAVSAQTGDGLDALRAALVDVAAAREARDVEGPARLPVDRVFTAHGFGTVVTGTLWSGRLRVDEDVLVLPAGRSARVRGLQVHGESVRTADAGQRVAVNLAGIDRADVCRGDVLAHAGGLVPTRRLDARVSVLANAAPLRHGARVHVHLGTAEILARVAVLGRTVVGTPLRGVRLPDALPPTVRPPDALPSTVRPPDIPAATSGWVRLRLEQPLPTRRGDRFVLRAYSPVTTIGGGIVLDASPPRRTNRAAAAGRLEALDLGADADAARESAGAALRRFVAEAAIDGIDIDGLPARLGVAPSAATTLVAAAVQAGRVVRLGHRLVTPESLDAVRTRVLALVDGHHAAEAASVGMPRAAVREQAARRRGQPLVDAVIDALVRDGVLAVLEDRLARAEHTAETAAGAEAEARVRARAREAGLHAETATGLIEAASLPRAEGDALLRRLVKDEHLVKLGDLYLDGEAVTRVVDELRELAGQSSPPAIDVSWFKQRYGITRRTAIPLLEMLDRRRVTRRVGESRVLIRP